MANPLLERLAKLDACAVSDAMDANGGTGAVLGLGALSATRRIVGRAVTVRLGPDMGVKSKRHLCTAAVEHAGPDSIIVIANKGRTDAASWGGVLSLAAHERGVAGVIIDGVCRDIDESREMGLPVYARGAVPITARGRVVEEDWNVLIDVAGQAVAPGDYVIADGSGVVFIPANEAETIIAAAERIAAKERLMAEAVRAGKPVSDVMGASYETMLTDGVR